jgi:hypothetical protein
LSVTIFEKTPILQALAQLDREEKSSDNLNQLSLFDL